MRKWVIEVGAVALIVGGVVGLRILLNDPPDKPAEAGTPELAISAADVPAQPAGQAAWDTTRGLDFWADRVAGDAGGRDWIARGELATYLIQYARETGDLTRYLQAREVLHEALEMWPPSLTNQGLLGVVEYALHDFVAAREIAESVYDTDPTATLALALLGDAAMQLGDYGAARESYTELLGTDPGPHASARLAELSFVLGDLEGAERLHLEAVAATAGAGGEQEAWYATSLSDFYLRVGRYDEALAMAEQALAAFPGYYLGLATRGTALAAQGDLAEATVAYEAATAVIPQPAFLATLGDLYAAAGRGGDAERQYQAVEAIAGLTGETPPGEAGTAAVYNRELARFLVTHDRNVDMALELARAEIDARPDVYAWDILAFALYRGGGYDDAAEAMQHALASGIQSSSVWYHAALIAEANGDAATARDFLEQALGLSPEFDVLAAPQAATLLAELPPEAAGQG